MNNNKYLKLKTIQNKNSCHFIENKNSCHFIENEIRDTLINIIILKKSNINISNLFPYNINLTVSVVSNKKEDIPKYYNEYITDNYENTINTILNNNLSKYLMIITDNYSFENNFIELLYHELNKINSNILLLFNDNQINKFNINIKFLYKINEPFLCIFNNNIKKKFNYNSSEIGIFLYINELLYEYELIESSTSIKFTLNNNQLNETIKLFDIYINQIEEITFNKNIFYECVDLLS